MDIDKTESFLQSQNRTRTLLCTLYTVQYEYVITVCVLYICLTIKTVLFGATMSHQTRITKQESPNVTQIPL